MNRMDRIERPSAKAAGRPGEIGAAIPVGTPPVLRRFWDFARKMAKEFGKHLVKNHEEEFLKVVRRDFENWRH